MAGRLTITGRDRNDGRPIRRPRHPSAKIITDDGLRLVLPFAPNDVELSGIADVFATIPRAGRKPLVVRTNNGLLEAKFSVLLAYRDPQRSVEPLLKTLKAIARAGDRCTLAGLSKVEGAPVWRLTDVGIRIAARQHGTNAITRATASLTFTEVVDAVVNVGPVSGGKKKKGERGESTGRTAARRHTTTEGETLAAVALRYYGDPNVWPVVADASGIRDPRNLPAGTVLTIPPA